MPRPAPATSEEIDAFLAASEGWALANRRLTRTFQFQDFRAAFAFMTRVAIHAERLDHHPDWSNVYKRVDVQLVTHDAGAITSLDFALARAMDEEARAVRETPNL